MERRRLNDLKWLLQKRDHRVHSSNTWLTEIVTLDGPVMVALKDLERSRMIPEFVAAELAALLGLATPKSFLVEVSARHLQEGGLQNGISNPDDPSSRLFFGSECLLFPVFERGPPETQYSRLVAMARSHSFAHIILFDTLIGNVDRAERNLLVDNGRLVLFDHDQAFFGLRWTPESLIVKVHAPNHSMFDTYLPWSDASARDFMLKTAKDWSGQVSDKAQAIMAALPSELGFEADERAAISAFIDGRAKLLIELVQQRLQSHPFQG